MGRRIALHGEARQDVPRRRLTPAAASSSLWRIARHGPMFEAPPVPRRSRAGSGSPDELGRRVDRERIELLEPPHRDAAFLGACLVTDDVVVDLARAKDETTDLVVLNGRVVEDRTERALRQILQRRRRVLEPQEPLRRQDNERTRCGRERLPAQQVEVLRRRRTVRDPDVRLCGELEKALSTRSSARGRCLVPAGAAASAVTSAPLRETAGDELVDHDLGAVDEVPELRLPQHERPRRIE